MSTGSLLAVPLVVGERRLGVIEAVRLSGESSFTVADIAMLKQLGDMIAIALENAGRFGEIKALLSPASVKSASLVDEVAAFFGFYFFVCCGFGRTLVRGWIMVPETGEDPGEHNPRNPSTETLILEPNEAVRVTLKPIQPLGGKHIRRCSIRARVQR